MLIIGIDPGIVSGFAIYDQQLKQLTKVTSFKLFQLFEEIASIQGGDVFVRIENPNTWFGFKGKADPARLQGAGAVKQTFKHTIEFLEFFKVEYQTVSLHSAQKKVNSDNFKRTTGWNKATNEHGRDAAMLCFQFHPLKIANRKI